MDQSAESGRSDRRGSALGENQAPLCVARTAKKRVAQYPGGGEPITESLVREIHKRLVEGVRGGAARPGHDRTIHSFVAYSRTREVVYPPPPPEEVPPRMAGLVTWLRSKTAVHPGLVPGIVQFQLVHIHSFLFGNGRTSRLLSTLCLYRSGNDFKQPFTLSESCDRGSSYAALQGVRAQRMDCDAAMEAIGSCLAGKTLTANQIEFVNLVVDHLTEHGVVSPERLYESRFTDLMPHGPESRFAASEFDELLKILDAVRATASAAGSPLWTADHQIRPPPPRADRQLPEGKFRSFFGVVPLFVT